MSAPAVGRRWVAWCFLRCGLPVAWGRLLGHGCGFRVVPSLSGYPWHERPRLCALDSCHLIDTGRPGFMTGRPGRYENVEIMGLYWHFVDLVWVFIFAFFYLW